MKLFLPIAYLGVIFLFWNPLTAAAIIKKNIQCLNVESKDHIDENYYFNHPSHDLQQQQRSLQEVAAVTVPTPVPTPVTTPVATPVLAQHLFRHLLEHLLGHQLQYLL